MGYYRASNGTHTIFVLILLLAIFGFVPHEQANAVGPPSSNAEEFAYARVFSAKIPDELDASVDELKAIAREQGSEEVLMFLESDGPEKQAERWIIRLGSEEYGYPPGLTVKARSHLARQKQLGALQMKGRGRATTAIAEQNARLQWVLPESVRSPLLCDIYEDSKLAAVNTIHERLSPSGKQHWPSFIHIRLPQRNWSIVQVFEYLDERPEGLSSVQEGPPQELPQEPRGSLPPGRISTKASRSEDTESVVASGATTNVKTEPASFSTFWPEWGFESSYDTGWKPRHSPVQFRFEADAAAWLCASVWGGEFRLEYDTSNPDDANLMLNGSGQGDLEMNFGVEAKTRGRVNVDLGMKEVDFKFNIPYAPNFDLRCYDFNSFEGYFPSPDNPVRVADSIEPQTLFSAPVTGIPKIADVTVNLKAEMEISAEMWAESITTGPVPGDANSAQEYCKFTPVCDLCDVNVGEHGDYLALADYDEHLEMQMVLTFYPDICVEVEVFIYEWDYCVSTFALPWKLALGTVDLDFSHRLNFVPSYDLVITSSYGAISDPAPAVHPNNVNQITLDCAPGELPVAATHTWNDTNAPLRVDVNAVTVTDPNYEFDYWILDGDGDNPISDSNYVVEFDSGSNDMFHTLHAVFYRAKATEPFPDDRMDKTGKLPTLSWWAGEHAVWHDVYFGTDYDQVSNADTNAEVYMGPQPLADASFDPCEYFGDLGDCVMYHWRVDEVNDSHPDSPWTGRTWSFRTVGCCASEPWPVEDAPDEPRNVRLIWKKGACVTTTGGHHLYLGTDYDDVNEADTSTAGLVHNGPVDANSYQIPEGERASLLPTTYYWRVDEVNDTYESRVTDPWKGPVWQFTAGHVVVDDFERYDTEVNKVEGTWTAGLGRPGVVSGANIVLETNADYVHGGQQSVRYDYDNNQPDLNYFSEIEANTVGAKAVAAEIGGDWTACNTKALVLQFYGEPNKPLNGDEWMYVALQDNISVWAEKCDKKASDVNEVNLDLQKFEGHVNLANITKIYIGFGDPSKLFPINPLDPLLPGGTGTVWFDDIRLYPPRCRPEMSRFDGGDFDGDCFVDFKDHTIIGWDWLKSDLDVQPLPPPHYYNSDPNLLVEYTFDSDCSDTSGNAYNGALWGDAYVSGGVLHLGGSGNVYVDPPDFNEVNPFDGSSDFSISIAFRTSEPGILISSTRNNDSFSHPMAVFVTDTLSRKGTVVRAAVVCGNYYVNTVAGDDKEVNPLDNEWHHAAVTYDANTNTHCLYIDGNSIWKGQFDPCIPHIEQDVVCIGNSLNSDFPDVNTAGGFDGDINSVRIYNRVLLPDEVCYLANEARGCQGLSCYYKLISPANIVDHVYDVNGPERRTKQVNFRDYDVMAENWLSTILWPPSQ
ncbi:MAG TPA: LamG-like jellyroll fold domain-containing protein [Sedimentisphaerales bacterium]|nr:LamG-like jellyroll fold domain-containing protein [Sedimentisphaerales bacterium]